MEDRDKCRLQHQPAQWIVPATRAMRARFNGRRKIRQRLPHGEVEAGRAQRWHFIYCLTRAGKHLFRKFREARSMKGRMAQYSVGQAALGAA